MINEKSFDKVVQGKQVGLFTLTSAEGLKAQITNYGAKIVSLFVPNAAGEVADVVLGFSTLQWLRYFTCGWLLVCPTLMMTGTGA